MAGSTAVNAGTEDEETWLLTPKVEPKAAVEVAAGAAVSWMIEEAPVTLLEIDGPSWLMLLPVESAAEVAAETTPNAMEEVSLV